jgi:hypothetical protein
MKKTLSIEIRCGYKALKSENVISPRKFVGLIENEEDMRTARLRHQIKQIHEKS